MWSLKFFYFASSTLDSTKGRCKGRKCIDIDFPDLHLVYTKGRCKGRKCIDIDGDIYGDPNRCIQRLGPG